MRQIIKFSKDAVEYTDDHGSSNEQCSKCEYWVNSTTCKIVRGMIRNTGWCNRFERD